MTENPLENIAPYGPQITTSIESIQQFMKSVGDYGMDAVSSECGQDITPLVSNAQFLLEGLKDIQALVQGALQLSDCSTVSPILRRIFHGATCNGAVSGFTWMFACFLGMTIFGMTMLSLRAALYNPTMRRVKKKPLNYVEQEWEDYRGFMARFYDDAHDWKFHPSPEKAGKKTLSMAPSFDTDITTRPSMEESSNGSPDPTGRFLNSPQDEVGSMDWPGRWIEDQQFDTPPRRIPANTFVDEVVMSERVRDLMHVLDNEWQRVSPEAIHAPPEAPKKMLKFLRRTNEEGQLQF